MTCRAALILLSVACPLLLWLLAVPGAASVWSVAPLVCALPILLIVISAGRRRPGAGGLLMLWLELTGTWIFLGMLAERADLAHPTPDQALLVVTTMLLGLGVLPLVLISWLFRRWDARYSSSGERTGTAGEETRA